MPQALHQYTGKGGEVQARLIGSLRLAAGEIGKQARLLFFDAVFHVASGTVELLVQSLGIGLTQEQVSHDKTGLGLARQIFRFANPPSFAGPALARPVAKVAEPACGLAGTLMGEACFVHGFTQCPLQTWVARHTQDIADVIGLTPGHDRCTAKPGIAAEHDPYLRPARTDLGETPLQFLDTAGLMVDKAVYHLPLYRQHQRMLDSGIRVSRSTLLN